MKRRVGLEGDETNLRVEVAQRPAGADKGAAGAQASHKMRHTQVRLGDNLRTGGFEVRLPVVGIIVLVGVIKNIGLRGGQRARFADGAVGALQGRRQAEFRAQNPQDADTLRADVFGHDQAHPVAQGCRQCGIGDAHVAGGGVQQHLFPRQLPAIDGRADDVERWPVLDRAAGIEPLGFRIDLHRGRQMRGDVAQAH